MSVGINEKDTIKQTIFILDSDIGTRKLLNWLLEPMGSKMENYESSEEFLATYKKQSGCIISNIRLKKRISGLKLQELLLEKNYKIPIIFVTEYGDIPMAVRAMKNGAIDFFAKPFNNQLLFEAVQLALDKNKQELKERKHLRIPPYRAIKNVLLVKGE